MAKGFQETTVFCSFPSCHISVKWPALQTIFKAGSHVCRQHLGSCSPLLSQNSHLTLNRMWCSSMIKSSFSFALISGVVLTTCFPLGQQTGMLLPVQHRESWGVPETFSVRSPSFFASFHPRSCKWEDLQTLTQEFYSVDLCQLCYMLTEQGPWWSLSIAQPVWPQLERVGQHRSVL